MRWIEDEGKVVDEIIELENRIGDLSEQVRRLTETNTSFAAFTFLSVSQQKT